MQGKPIYLEKNNIVLETVYDSTKNLYTTETIDENRNKKFKIRNLFRRKNLKTF